MKMIYNLNEFMTTEAIAAMSVKDILQSALKTIDQKGRGVLVINPDVDYGFKRNLVETHPDLSNHVNDLLIIDFSLNSQYDGAEGDGMQARYFYNTKNEMDGQHDGNTMWINGNHHPALMIMNNGKTNNNRRGTLFFGNDGEVTWGIGQGINTAGVSAGIPINAHDDILTHFKIIANKIAGGGGLETILAINKVTGFWSFGGEPNPDAEYHFRTRRGTKGEMKLESHENNLEIQLQTPTKFRKFTIRDDNGSINLTDLTGKSNVYTITDEGEVIARGGVNLAVSALPTNPQAGRLVYHNGALKLFKGTSWVTIG